MLSFKCKTCGGELSVNDSGLLCCDYCGSRCAFGDDELLGYRHFRRQVLNYLRGVRDQKADEAGRDENALWESAETTLLKTDGGGEITIRYLHSHEDGGASVYLSRNSILYVFPSAQRHLAEQMIQGIGALSFPPADMKGLRDCFPSLTGQYALAGGGIMLACERPEHLFPLSMFGSLAPDHAAWVISRLENICCVLEYSGLIHGGISEHSVWINPFTHHAVLHGHWWGAQKKQGRRGSSQDLLDLRKTAARILGIHKSQAPAEMLDFLNGKPADNAYADFEKWDRVIQEGFGGRRFAKMDVEF